MADDKITRRTTLTALGTAILGGCTTNQQNQTEQPQQNQTPNQTDPEPTNQTNNQKNNDNQEQNNTWNWNNVLQAEQEAKQFNAEQLDNVHERALQGEEIEESYSIDFSKNRHNYTHGGHTWDLQHFQSHDVDTYEGFLDAASDAITLGVHYIQQNENEGFPSSWRTEIGSTAELLLEQAHDLEDTHIWGWGNDGHGFNYILSEDHGVSLIDTTTNHAGRAGTNPLQNAPYGNDIISQFNETWIDPNSDIPGFKANIAQNFATNGMYEGINEANVGVHLPLLPEIFNKFKQEDSGEFLWNKHRPAVATSVYKRKAENFAEDEGIMINPESIEDLPDLRNYDNFQNYKTELEKHTETLVGEEAMGEVYLGEKE